MITEKDFIDKMVEIAKDSYEYMDQLQCIFFTWNEFFNTDNDIAVAFSIASQIYSEAYSDEEPLTESNDFWSELASIL